MRLPDVAKILMGRSGHSSRIIPIATIGRCSRGVTPTTPATLYFVSVQGISLFATAAPVRDQLGAASWVFDALVYLSRLICVAWNCECTRVTLSGIGCLQRRNIKFDHPHHGVSGSLGLGSIGGGQHLREHRWDHLPRKTETVLQPTTLLRRTAVCQERVPVAIDLGLCIAVDDERDCMVERVE